MSTPNPNNAPSSTSSRAVSPQVAVSSTPSTPSTSTNPVISQQNNQSTTTSAPAQSSSSSNPSSSSSSSNASNPPPTQSSAPAPAQPSSSSSSMAPVNHVSQLMPVHIKALNKEYRNQVQQASQSPENSEQQREHFLRARRIQILLQQYEESKKKPAGNKTPVSSPGSVASTTTGSNSQPMASQSNASNSSNLSNAPKASNVSTASNVSNVSNTSSSVNHHHQQQQQHHHNPHPQQQHHQQQQGMVKPNQTVPGPKPYQKPLPTTTVPNSNISTNINLNTKQTSISSSIPNQKTVATKTIGSGLPSSNTINTSTTTSMANRSVGGTSTNTSNTTSKTDGLDALLKRLNGFKSMQNEYESKLASVEQILKSSSTTLSEAERAKFKQQELNFRTLRDQAKSSVLIVTQELQRTVPAKPYSQPSNSNAGKNINNNNNSNSGNNNNNHTGANANVNNNNSTHNTGIGSGQMSDSKSFSNNYEYHHHSPVPHSISKPGTSAYPYSLPGPGTNKSVAGSSNISNMAKNNSQISGGGNTGGVNRQTNFQNQSHSNSSLPVQRSQSYQALSHQQKSLSNQAGNSQKQDFKSSGVTAASVNYGNNNNNNSYGGVNSGMTSGSTGSHMNSSNSNMNTGPGQSQQRNLSRANSPQLKGPGGVSGLSEAAASQMKRAESSPYLSTYNNSSQYSNMKNSMGGNTGGPGVGGGAHTSMAGSGGVSTGSSNFSKLGQSYSSMQNKNPGVMNQSNNMSNSSTGINNLNNMSNMSKMPGNMLNKSSTLNNNANNNNVNNNNNNNNTNNNNTKQRVLPDKLSRPAMSAAIHQKRPSFSATPSSNGLSHLNGNSSNMSYGSMNNNNSNNNSNTNTNQSNNTYSNLIGSSSNYTSSLSNVHQQASATPLSLPIADRVFNKRKIHELIKDLTPEDLDGTIDNDVDDLIGDLVEEFVADVTKFTCRLAKHRKSEQIDIKDTQLHLERNWNVRVPGHLPDDVPVLKRPVPSKSYIHKLDAIALYRTFGGNPFSYNGGAANGSSGGN